MSPTEALAAWPRLEREAVLRPITTGLINQTFQVECPEGRFALQRVNPIFGVEVNADIEAVTVHVAARGLPTPRLVRTEAGAAAHEVEGEVWRILTWLDGHCFDTLQTPAMARSAGELLGRFHAALADFDAEFRHQRLGVHDTPAHLAGLASALESHTGHPDHARIAPLGDAILEAAAALPPLPLERERVVHGDPKISNLLFTPEGTGLALVDLDTVARMPVALELGDALRSWCNPAGEDAVEVRFDLTTFEAAAEGYLGAAGATLSPEERGSLAVAARTITLELAARFCRDALEDRYFGWNADRYPSRSEHNRVRAQAQLALALDLSARSDAAEAVLADVLSRLEQRGSLGA